MNIPKEILPNVSFACGPSQGHPVIRNTPLSETLFERSHRAGDLTTNGLYKETAENVKKLLGVPDDYTLIFHHGGATTAMDAVAWSLTKDSISGLAFGSFSKIWCKNISEQLPENIKKDFKKPAEGEYFPSEKPDFTASLVLMTPNETSMGVQIPDSYLIDAWEKKGSDTLIAWDCTSCAGGRDLPKGKYDVMLFSTQKCFGTGGGSSIVILSPKAVERAKEISASRKIAYVLDLAQSFDKVAKFQTLNTPSTTNIWMTNEAAKWMLASGGVAAMDKLCRAHAQYLLDFVAKTDYLEPMITPEENRSFVTVTLRVKDAKLVDSEINDAIKKSGKACLKDGIGKYGKYKENSLRIACFPFTDIDGTGEFELLCKTIDYVANELRKNK
ncbi:phosphoserine aminotransferase [Parelusimicrobium proximum]|uniref:aminotransferase class V-fold PLP-dependent enzyme n=1 Tax=Parelusimicrobium proximum TaxID=3228953 RepID=UPI003D1830BE